MEIISNNGKELKVMHDNMNMTFVIQDCIYGRQDSNVGFYLDGQKVRHNIKKQSVYYQVLMKQLLVNAKPGAI
jgi:hypothetical protein